MALTPAQAGRVYDRIGRAQDWQAFYEGAAVNDLLAHAELDRASGVLELGCGTGRLAARMLETLPPTASYLGLDVSARMLALSGDRLRAWAPRARVQRVDGALPLPVADGSVDRVVSTYVFDLLDDDYARAVLADLRRALAPGGLLCLVSLTDGQRPIERGLAAAWTAVWRRAPKAVGGCRPIRLAALVEQAGWGLRHRRRVHAYGLVSEVVVAVPGPA